MPLEMFKFAMHSTSAVFCELRVSDVTGEARVDRLLGSFDCGRILNSKTAASQFRGGMIMGLGLGLTEETLFDEGSVQRDRQAGAGPADNIGQAAAGLKRGIRACLISICQP